MISHKFPMFSYMNYGQIGWRPLSEMCTKHCKAIGHSPKKRSPIIVTIERCKEGFDGSSYVPTCLPWFSHGFSMIFPCFSRIFKPIHRFPAPRHRELPRHQRGCNLLSLCPGLLASASKDALVVSLAEMLGVLPRILKIYHHDHHDHSTNDNHIYIYIIIIIISYQLSVNSYHHHQLSVIIIIITDYW